jgi:uncharacterized protein YbcI
MAGQTKYRGDLAAVSRAMVALHKKQFGRGPIRARSYFGGGNVLTCVLDQALLPAELKMVEMGETDRVRDARVSFQAATAAEFINAVEQIVYRRVQAFASAVDPKTATVFEVFTFEPQEDGWLIDTEGSSDGDEPA